MSTCSCRQEVDSLRGNRQKNDHLTVQWLSSAVSELRAELSEMAAAHNASADLQRTQQTETELRALRGDVAAVRSDIDALRAGVARAQAAAEAAASEARAAASNAQQARASCRDARANVSCHCLPPLIPDHLLLRRPSAFHYSRKRVGIIFISAVLRLESLCFTIHLRLPDGNYGSQYWEIGHYSYLRVRSLAFFFFSSSQSCKNSYFIF